MGIPPIPDIAELTIRAGIEPCQVGGTDIAPTNRALPKSPAIPAPRPPAPPNAFISGTALPTNFAESAPNAPAPVAPANAAAELPWLPICAKLIIGEIIMLAGYIAIWATDVNDDNGTADSAADALDNAAAGSAIAPATAVPADVNAEVTPAPTTTTPPWPASPTSRPQPPPAHPTAKTNCPTPPNSSAAHSNCDNVEATDVAPA